MHFKVGLQCLAVTVTVVMLRSKADFVSVQTIVSSTPTHRCTQAQKHLKLIGWYWNLSWEEEFDFVKKFLRNPWI